MISQADFDVIATLDLDPIKVKLMHRESGEGWSLAQANAVEVEYRRFLYLMKEFPNELAAPRFDVDIFWHYHILDTAKYAQDCEAFFGYFLHHFPYMGLRGEDDLEMHHQVGERMRELYEQTFGEPYVREAEPPAGTSTGSSEGTCKIVLSPAAAATAFSVRAPVSVVGTDTAFSVRSPASIAGAQTAFSVRTPASASRQTAFSVRAPASAGSGTAFSVRAPAPLGTTQVATSPPASRFAQANQRHLCESASCDHAHNLAAFYSIRPRLDTAGTPQWAQ